MSIKLPEILDIPPKLIPMITGFNKHRRILLTGGRGGGKTQAVARMLLWVSSKKKVRIVCGRELQSSITESVYTVFADLIDKYSLDFTVQANKIICNSSGSEMTFKGFREQGRTNIKGLEGIDILWIDEAEAITKDTLDIINPTIRKPKSKLIFTMNRRTRFDPVFIDNDKRDDCLSIKINYDDNKYCPKELINEAMECREKSEEDYRHIWLGEPKSQGDMVVFNTIDLDNCKKVDFFGSTATKGRVLSVDIANGGGDLTVAGILDWISPTRFQLVDVITWDVKNLMETTGRIQELKHKYSPNVIVVDATGIGEGAYDRLCELGAPVIDFKGARKSADLESFNTRAEAFFKTRDLTQKGQIHIVDDRVLADLEVMKYKLSSNGKKQILSKYDIRKEIQRSPDFADMLSMAVWGLDKLDFMHYNGLQTEYENEDY